MAVIELPRRYRTDLVLRYLGRDSDSLIERVEGNTIHRAEVTIRVDESSSRRVVESSSGRVDESSSGRVDESSSRRVDEASSRQVLESSSSEADESSSRQVIESSSTTRRLDDWSTPQAVVRGPVAVARRLLGLNIDPTPFERAHPELVRGHEGAHLPQTATVWESVMWAIVGQQVNLPFAFRLRRVIVDLCGRPAKHGLRVHPTAEEVARLDYGDLTARQFSRSKAQYVIDTARLIASGALPVETFPSRTPEEVEAALTAVRGIGFWTANYVMMRGCAFADAVPAGDSALSASLREHFHLDHKVDAKETLALMERFRPWRALATYHFWLSRAKPIIL